VDALAVGLSLALIGSTIALPAVVIGLVAAAFTATGMALGRQIGARRGRRAEVLGGVILIAIGTKVALRALIRRLTLLIQTTGPNSPTLLE
jgi:putative Mn2+ efflux pump MntP